MQIEMPAAKPLQNKALGTAPQIKLWIKLWIKVWAGGRKERA